MNGKSYQVNATDAQLRTEWAEINTALAGMHDLLAKMVIDLDEIAKLQRRKMPIRRAVVLGGSGTPPVGIAYLLHMEGYRHSRLWLPAAATLSVDLGFGGVNLSLAAGWNVLDAGDNSLIATTAGTNINAVLELTDDPVQ